ncbi:MAG: hypothetical protein HY683_04245 [Chloroflexi bacterium]|nr:hypothetical protein [Chloroflexota bacterium]
MTRLWDVRVYASAGQPQAIQQFYLDQLKNLGWAQVIHLPQQGYLKVDCPGSVVKRNLVVGLFGAAQLEPVHTDKQGYVLVLFEPK